MAGSYGHLKHGWSMIENMGDAHECVEELLYLVESIIGKENAEKALKEYYYPMSRGEVEKDPAFVKVQETMQR